MKICDECETVAHCTKHGCVPKQQALDKMAENARELGLDYTPAQTDWEAVAADQAMTIALMKAEQPAQQEPVAAECKFDREEKWVRCEIAHHNLVQSEPEKWPGYQTRLLYTSHQPAQQQEPVLCCGKYETCTQACTPRGRFLGKREALAEQPAQPVTPCTHPSLGACSLREDGTASRWNCVMCGTEFVPKATNRWAEFNETTKRNIQHAEWYLSIYPQPAQQEPVAWYRDENGIRMYYESKVWDDATPLYTSPPAQRTWVEVEQVKWEGDRLVAKLKEKNT